MITALTAKEVRHNMGGNKALNFLRKYMMLIATVIVVIAFYFITDGKVIITDQHRQLDLAERIRFRTRYRYAPLHPYRR